MTRFIHDQFAKDYLEELLAPFGEVLAPRRVAGEVREIDVWFVPAPEASERASVNLGLLGRLMTSDAAFEPFRNPVTPDEICSCLSKVLQVREKYQRDANRNKTKLQEASYPKLWILTPTASAELLGGFHARIDENWLPGVYFLGEYLRTAIVVIHQLPRTPETLWLRVLGKGTVQKQAIDSLEALPENHPFRAIALDLLYNLRKNLEITQASNEEDRELIMRLAPLYQQDRELAKKEGQRQVVENLLRVRFGTLDEPLLAIIEPLMALPPEEFTPLLVQLSREELLARFGGQG